MLLSLGLLVAALSAPPPVQAAEPCRFAGETRAWTAEALRAWDRLDQRRLGIRRPIVPVIYLFDQACVYELTPSRYGDFRVGGRRYRSAARAHDGQVRMPDGATVPAQKLAFASPMSDGGMFFTMALPAIWRADETDQRDPRLLSMVVFMHEFAHTQQGSGLGRRIDGLLAGGLPADATDDVIQNVFGTQPDYVAAYEAERDLFYEAGTTPDPRAARQALTSATRMMAERRARWFTGDQAFYAETDDVFLTLEGTGNWAAWTWLTDPGGGRLSPADATAFVRGGRRWWSQDEGLGVMLALQRFTPEWPRLAFSPEGATADDMLARALQPSRSRE